MLGDPLLSMTIFTTRLSGSPMSVHRADFPARKQQRKVQMANSMSQKFRTDLILVLVVQSLAFMMTKLNLARELEEDLQSCLGVSLFAD